MLHFHIIDPPQKFDPKMKSNKFLLLLNANGISYKLCKKLEGEKWIKHHILAAS